MLGWPWLYKWMPSWGDSLRWVTMGQFGQVVTLKIIFHYNANKFLFMWKSQKVSLEIEVIGTCAKSILSPEGTMGL